MNFHKTKNTCNLDKKAYTFSLIGLLLLLFLWLIIDAFSSYYKSKISINSLKQAIYKKQYDVAKEISLDNKEKNFVLEIAKKHIPFIRNDNISVSKENILLVFDILNALNDNDLNKLISSSKKLKEEIKSNKNAEKKLINLAKSIEKIAKDLKLENENNKKYLATISDLKAKKIRIKRRHTLVADEFANFLSLEPNYKKGTELKAYEAGVLYGLPILKGLRDGIGTLPELKDELDSLGGKVEIQAPNAYEIFIARILSLRETSTKIRNEYKESNTNLKLTKKEIDMSNNQIKQLTNSLSEKIDSFLIEAN